MCDCSDGGLMQTKRICSNCGSDKTYVSKNGHEQWRYDKEGNIICNKCHVKEWYVKNRDKKLDYQKVYNALTRTHEYNKVDYILRQDYQSL